MFWKITSKSLDLERPLFLGILNITPDSFSDGGRHAEPQAAFIQATSLVSDGAAILDLGAESTRPGADPIAPDIEWDRLHPVLDLFRLTLPEILLSLDTRHAITARKGLAQGIAIVNDITGFSDPALLALACESSCGLIAMRSRKKDGRLFIPDYGATCETTADLAIEELKEIKDRLLGAGIDPKRILLDPGFGLGTTFQEDLAIWNALPVLPGALDWPVQRFCLGVSRKRFLAWRAGVPTLPPDQRDCLTHEAHVEAMAWGYRIFRTHAVHSSINRQGR